MHPSTLGLGTGLLPPRCGAGHPSFSCPAGELLCRLQDPIQMFRPLKPFQTQRRPHITSSSFWPGLFLLLPQGFHSCCLKYDFFLQGRLHVSLSWGTATGSPLPKTGFLKVKPGSPRRLLTAQIAGPQPTVPAVAGLGQGLIVCIFNKV